MKKLTTQILSIILNPFVKVLCTDEKVDKHNILMALAYIKERFKNCKEIASYFQRTLLS